MALGRLYTFAGFIDPNNTVVDQISLSMYTWNPFGPAASPQVAPKTLLKSLWYAESKRSQTRDQLTEHPSPTIDVHAIAMRTGIV